MRVDYQDASGDTIYTQYVKVKEGLNSWRWAMWQSGQRYLSSKSVKRKSSKMTHAVLVCCLEPIK